MSTRKKAGSGGGVVLGHTASMPSFPKDATDHTRVANAPRELHMDPADFERLHSQHLTRLPGVARVQSSFALRTVRKSAELPVRA